MCHYNRTQHELYSSSGDTEWQCCYSNDEVCLNHLDRQCIPHLAEIVRYRVRLLPHNAFEVGKIQVQRIATQAVCFFTKSFIPSGSDSVDGGASQQYFKAFRSKEEISRCLKETSRSSPEVCIKSQGEMVCLRVCLFVVLLYYLCFTCLSLGFSCSHGYPKHVDLPSHLAVSRRSREP